MGQWERGRGGGKRKERGGRGRGEGKDVLDEVVWDEKLGNVVGGFLLICCSLVDACFRLGVGRRRGAVFFFWSRGGDAAELRLHLV